MSRPRLLDLFCGAGGAGMGYARAGFDVVGVDIKPQPRYPFAFIQADALEYLAAHGPEYDAIHASPPCQAYSITKTIWRRAHPDLLGPTRDALLQCSRPWIIENVIGAPMRNGVVLCGTMFGLPLYRHRQFESSMVLLCSPCDPHEAPCTVVGRRPKPGEFITIAGHFSDVSAARAAMGIDWMSRAELAQAIPPAYTEYLGRQLLNAVTLEAGA